VPIHMLNAPFLSKLNGWQRIGIVISVAWALFVNALWLYEHMSIQSFSDEMAEGHNATVERFWVSWTDGRTGKPLTIFQAGERLLSSNVMDQRATSLQRAAAEGKIHPELRVHWILVTVAILVPIAAFWLASYFFVWLIHWIIRGFRGSGRVDQ